MLAAGLCSGARPQSGLHASAGLDSARPRRTRTLRDTRTLRGAGHLYAGRALGEATALCSPGHARRTASLRITLPTLAVACRHGVGPRRRSNAARRYRPPRTHIGLTIAAMCGVGVGPRGVARTGIGVSVGRACVVVVTTPTIAGISDRPGAIGISTIA